VTHHVMRNVIALVLGGGRGTRLYPLTKYRSKPAVPLAGKYRLIDIPLTNCIHSGLNRIYVLTQFMSVSLHRHIRQAYRFDRFDGGFVEILAAQQTMVGTDWYQGTADAVRKQLRYVQQSGIDFVLILSGDQLYRMDYAKMLEAHRSSGADVTIAGIPVHADQAKSLGIMRCDSDGRVVGFLEKPQTPEEVAMVRTDPGWIQRQGIPSRGRDCLGNMGIYLFNRSTLVDVLEKTEYHDFGKEVFPASMRSRVVKMHLFDDYWEDIGTTRAFYEASLQLAGPNPPFDLSSPDAPVYTRARFLPPSLLEGATIRQSLIADGCHIGRGTIIENSIVGLRCQIGDHVVIRNSVLMGCDEYESKWQQATNDSLGRPSLGIGANSVVEGAIVDKNCRIGRDVRIVNQAGIQQSDDADDCMICDGIPIIIKDAVLPDGWCWESRLRARFDPESTTELPM
jgi:glucose-1-phosphate adenylyltransferase